MKPTYQQVDELASACTALGDTYNKISQRSGQDYTDPVPYRFGAKSKDVRQAAAHNLRLLNPLREEFTDLKNKLLMDVTGGKGHIERHEGELNAKYNMALRDLQKTPVKEDLPLEHIAEADLNLEQNPIPPAVIAILAIIPAPKPITDA